MADRGGRAGKQAAKLARERTALQKRIAASVAAREWAHADRDLIALSRQYRERSAQLPVTQSDLATFHAQWGLVLTGQRRPDEADRHLTAAERLFNMEYEEAVEWAGDEGILVEEVGNEVDLRLALEVLKILAESAVRQGRPDVESLLPQVVAVADLVGDPDEQWAARERLAAFNVASARWEQVIELGREMGWMAQSRRKLPLLQSALRFLTEALIGLREMDEALATQGLLVDVGRFLGDPTLPAEEAALARIQSRQLR